MSGSWLTRLTDGLKKSRDKLAGDLNVLLRRGANLDEEFWSDLEDVLVGADIGVTAVTEIVERLRDDVHRNVITETDALLDHLANSIAAEFVTGESDPLAVRPLTLLVVGINGAGKTTTVGKLAKSAADSGTSVLLGSADTYRAAATEQLEIWAERSNVPIVRRERGSDPASVAYETLERAQATGTDLTIIDTAGRLHTSADLMRELKKVRDVVSSKSTAPMFVLLVIDATTGQNGLVQAREFNRALQLDGVIITKLDGTAKGGIAVAIARDLGLPIVRIGVGESIDDLHAFDPLEFARALITAPR